MPSINEIKSVFFKYWEMYKTYVLPFLPLITLMIALGVISYIKGGFNRLTLEGIVYLLHFLVLLFIFAKGFYSGLQINRNGI